MDITVLIITRNEEKNIGESLDGLLNQSLPASEILVVDDNSQDRTREIVRGYAERLPIRLIEKHKAQGNRSESRNIGFREARNDFVAIMDAGSLPSRDWLREMARTFAGGHDYCHGNYHIREDTLLDSCQECLTNLMKTTPVMCCRSFAVSRRVFEQIQFDEALLIGEDRDFFERMRAAGFRGEYNAGALALYKARESLAAVFRQYRNYMTWQARAGTNTGAHVLRLGFYLTLLALLLAGLWQPVIAAAAAVLFALYMAQPLVRYYTRGRKTRLRDACAFPILLAVCILVMDAGKIVGWISGGLWRLRAGQRP